MGHDIEADFTKQYCFPPAIEDFVPVDHPARFIREFVAILDLDELGFQKRKSSLGRSSWSPRLILRVMLYGWFIKIRTLRGFENGCRENVAMMWLSGMNVPDHNEFWRFFRDNKKVLKKLLKETARLAAQCDMVDFVVHAVDGTKLRADVCQDKSILKKKVKALNEYCDALAEHIIDETEERIKGQEPPRDRIPEALQEREMLRQTINKKYAHLKRCGECDITPDEAVAITQLHKDLTEKKTSAINSTDDDARLMKITGKLAFGYNAQLAVSSKHRIIVAADLHNHGYDNHSLLPMLEAITDTVGKTADQTLFDGGYHTAENLYKAEERGDNVLVAERRHGSGKPFDKARFRYDKHHDCYICPSGRWLRFRGERHLRGVHIREYECSCFQTCPYRSQCSTNKTGRKITRTLYEEALERQRRKRKKTTYKKLYRKRKEVAELPFAEIKVRLGFRRWTVRGLEKCRAQWYYACSVYNIKKMYHMWRLGLIRFHNNGLVAAGHD